MATSTKENQAVIVQEDQDEYFRDKMEEYKLFLERHPDYYDDGLIVDDFPPAAFLELPTKTTTGCDFPPVF